MDKGQPAFPPLGMYRFMGSVAEENPGIWAFSFWGMPGPWSENLDGVSPSYIETHDFAESGL